MMKRMKIVRGLFSPLPALASPVATLGAFDGVHRGHQRILRETVAWAASLAAKSAVVTFDPLPKAVVGPGGALCITSLAHRLALMERLGLDLAVVIPFDATVAAMPAEQFAREVLIGWLRVRHLVFGRDSTFGRNAEGDLALLRRLEAQGLIAVRSPAPVRYRGKVISSTAIRQAIGSGDLRAAAAMLGRPFSLLGTVVPGDRRGRALGFPTANLDLHHEAIPPAGVYATIAYLAPDPTRKRPRVARIRANDTPTTENRKPKTALPLPAAYPALTYVGRRPTFQPDDAPTTIEVHIIGLNADLYGRDIEVQFIRKLRRDIRFPSSAALIAQMQADLKAALAAISSSRAGRRGSTENA